MAKVCTVTAAKQGASDKQVLLAASAAQNTAAKSVLQQLVMQSAGGVKQLATKSIGVLDIPAALKKKHDVIYWLRSAGVAPHEIVSIVQKEYGWASVSLKSIANNIKGYGADIPMHKLFKSIQAGTADDVVTAQMNALLAKISPVVESQVATLEEAVAAVASKNMELVTPDVLSLAKQASKAMKSGQDFFAWKDTPGVANLLNVQKMDAWNAALKHKASKAASPFKVGQLVETPQGLGKVVQLIDEEVTMVSLKPAQVQVEIQGGAVSHYSPADIQVHGGGFTVQKGLYVNSPEGPGVVLQMTGDDVLVEFKHGVQGWYPKNLLTEPAEISKKAYADALSKSTDVKDKINGLPQVPDPLAPDGHMAHTMLVQDHSSEYLQNLATEPGWRHALKDYTGNGYKVINAAAREGRTIPRITHIDNAMSPLRRDVVVWRGIGRSRHPLNQMSFEDLVRSVGTTYEETSFVSTSPDVGTAFSFAKRNDVLQSRIVIRMLVPRGKKAFYIDAYSPVARGEKELLLPRNQKFRIKGVYRGSMWSDSIIVDVEAI